MKNQKHNHSTSLLILKCLYVIMSFLCVCSFSESAISFLSPSFNKSTDIQLWLTATQVSIATISLFLVAILISPVKRCVNTKWWDVLGFSILIAGCVELVYLTEASNSLRKITSFDLSVSSSVCFIISTLVLIIGSVITTLLKDRREKKEKQYVSTLQNYPLIFISTVAQLLGNTGFLIQSLTGNKYSVWNEIAFACFITGLVSATYLLKNDVKHLCDLVAEKVQNIDQTSPACIEMVHI